MPLVASGVPQLVEQPVLGGDQPGQQGRVQADTLAGFGKHLLVGDKTVVPLRQGQGAIQVQDLAAERAAAGIAEVGPDLVEGHLELIGGRAIGRIAIDQAPIEQGTLARQHVTQHAVARFTVGTQVGGGIQVAAQATATGGDVEHQLQALQRQAFEARITTFQAQAPDPTQAVRQLLAGGVGQVYRGFAGGDRKFFRTRQLAMGIEGCRHGRAGQRQACDEPTSRDGHCLP